MYTKKQKKRDMALHKAQEKVRKAAKEYLILALENEIGGDINLALKIYDLVK
jgi:hypothetical protein